MIKLDLHRALAEPAWPGMRIFSRFADSAGFLALLVEYVPLMQDQALVRWRASFAREGPPENVAELQEKLDDLTVKLGHEIAANFYGAFTFSISAALESSLTDLCGYVKAREQCDFKLSDLREQNSVKKALLYLQIVLRERFAGVDRNQKSLRDLQNVRNVLAHANGSVVEQQPDRKKELETLAASGKMIKISDGHVVV
jgi:hypothetical protein